MDTFDSFINVHSLKLVVGSYFNHVCMYFIALQHMSGFGYRMSKSYSMVNAVMSYLASKTRKLILQLIVVLPTRAKYIFKSLLIYISTPLHTMNIWQIFGFVLFDACILFNYVNFNSCYNLPTLPTICNLIMLIM